jgi:SM-20-related protein
MANSQDQEIVKLLQAITMPSKNNDFMKFMQEEDDKERKEKEQQKQDDLGALPPQLKMKILSFLDQKTVEDSVKSQKYELLPAIKFTPFMKPDAKLKFFSMEDVLALENKGYFIKDNFLKSPELLDKIIEESNKLYDDGILYQAGMNKGQGHWTDNSIRGDYIAWLNDPIKNQVLCPNVHKLVEKINELRDDLNETCNFECTKHQVQLACYPGNDTRYVRHLDAFVGGSHRRLTCIYYCNKNWQKDHGGCVRLFLDDGTLDVEPVADRLLVFQSRLIEHEVLATTAKRFAITTFFY